jgi:hypothetical protein
MAENAACGERKRDNFGPKKFLNFPIIVSQVDVFEAILFLRRYLAPYFFYAVRLVVFP